MPKKGKPSVSKVIEIEDSTDDESANTSNPITSKPQERKSVTISTSGDTNSKPEDATKKKLSFSSSFESKKTSDEFDIPRRIMSRRKSVHHSIRSTEDLSFECPTRKRRESVDAVASKLNKKNRWDDSQIDDAVDHNLDDPEIEQMLKKIAYCRVFTNYLLRQYDMLAIDFKLYSNLDMLDLDLKMRVDTYTAIRKSRQRFREAREMNNGQIQL